MSNQSNNKKLASNLFLMFLIYFMPKVLSFLLVPLYTAYLTAAEYGTSDVIINTSSLVQQLICFGIAAAVMRFTIENKEDKRPFQIGIRFFCLGLLLLIPVAVLAMLMFKIEISYVVFVVLITETSILADINLCYVRGMERMKLITICGIGSSVLSLLSNVLFIVVFRWGLYGFLLSSIVGYTFNIVVISCCNKNDHALKGIWKLHDKTLQKEMLQYGVPLVLSGLSWWVISSSDRYFVTAMCGVAVNGLYAVAYKIPTIIQSIQNVFIHSWVFTLYDSYKSKEGKEYIARVYDFYCFIMCGCGSLLICLCVLLAKFLFSNEFFEAWVFVPPLVISVVLNGLGGFMGEFLPVYKETKYAATISVVAAITNIVLNFVLIKLFNSAMGAAVATVITYFVYWCMNIYKGLQLSHIRINLKKQILVLFVLVLQSIAIIVYHSTIVAGILFIILLLINWSSLKWAVKKAHTLTGTYLSKSS